MKCMRKFGAGDTVKFTVVRVGQETTADVTLNPRPLETSPDYDVVYESAGEPGKRVRLMVTKPKNPGKYPAVMFKTGDADTRVAPLHARKMTALMQSATSSGRPVLLHYDTSVGHSTGLPVTKEIDDGVDVLTFLMSQTGLPLTPSAAESR